MIADKMETLHKIQATKNRLILLSEIISEIENYVQSTADMKSLKGHLHENDIETIHSLFTELVARNGIGKNIMEISLQIESSDSNYKPKFCQSKYKFKP